MEGRRGPSVPGAPREKTKTNNQVKTNKICFEKETHWIHLGISNRTMTMSIRMTTVMTTRANQEYHIIVVFSGYHRFHNNRKEVTVIHTKSKERARSMHGRKTDQQKS